MSEFAELQDKLLVRCFSKQKYLDDFLSGKCVHMGSAENYWKMENGFQGDPFDCAVISLNDDIKWSMWIGDDHPRVKICDAESFSIGVDAFLYCMFAVPKTLFSVRTGTLYIDEDSNYHDDFFRFLDEYAKTKEHVFVCAFDAASFMLRITNRLREKGLSYTAGYVTYKNNSIADRISSFSQKRIDDIVFTKQESYQYQREYRIAVKHKMDVNHIDIDGVCMNDIVFFNGEYHSLYEADK